MILPVSRAQKQWMDRFGDMLPGARAQKQWMVRFGHMLPGSMAQKQIRLPKASSWSRKDPAEFCMARSDLG
nr:MAG TPA: hypothetical protein [Caudoviricetes sp.]